MRSMNYHWIIIQWVLVIFGHLLSRVMGRSESGVDLTRKICFVCIKFDKNKIIWSQERSYFLKTPWSCQHARRRYFWEILIYDKAQTGWITNDLIINYYYHYNKEYSLYVLGRLGPHNRPLDCFSSAVFWSLSSLSSSLSVSVCLWLLLFLLLTGCLPCGCFDTRARSRSHMTAVKPRGTFASA